MLPSGVLREASCHWSFRLENAGSVIGPKDAATGWPVVLERGLSPAEMEGVPLLANFLRTGKLQLADGRPPSVAQLAGVSEVTQRAPACFRLFVRPLRMLVHEGSMI